MCHVEMELKKLGEPLSFFNFLLGGPIFRSYYAPCCGGGGGGGRDKDVNPYFNLTKMSPNPAL